MEEMKESEFFKIESVYCPLCGSTELKHFKHSTTCIKCGMDFYVVRFGYVLDKKILESYKIKWETEKKFGMIVVVLKSKCRF